MKPVTGSDENGSACSEKLCKRNKKKKRMKSEEISKNRAEHTYSDDLSSSYSEASDDEKKEKSSERGCRGPSKHTDLAKLSSSESESDNEQNWKSSRLHTFNSDSKKKKLEVIQPLSDVLTEAIDEESYHLASKSAP